MLYPIKRQTIIGGLRIVSMRFYQLTINTHGSIDQASNPAYKLRVIADCRVCIPSARRQFAFIQERVTGFNLGLKKPVLCRIVIIPVLKH